MFLILSRFKSSVGLNVFSGSNVPDVSMVKTLQAIFINSHLKVPGLAIGTLSWNDRTNP